MFILRDLNFPKIAQPVVRVVIVVGQSMALAVGRVVVRNPHLVPADEVVENANSPLPFRGTPREEREQAPGVTVPPDGANGGKILHVPVDWEKAS